MTRGSTVTEGLNSDGGLIVHALSTVWMEQIMRLLRLHGELAVTIGSRVRAFLQLFNVLRLKKGFGTVSLDR